MLRLGCCGVGLDGASVQWLDLSYLCWCRASTVLFSVYKINVGSFLRYLLIARPILVMAFRVKI